LNKRSQSYREFVLRDLLEQSYLAAVAAADPHQVLANYLPNAQELSTFKRIVVVGAGKAGGSMAAAFESTWRARVAQLPSLALVRLEGLVVTRYGHGAPTTQIRLVEAAHPVPDKAGLSAAQEILSLVRSVQPDELLIALISGGGSSLLSLPVESVTMDELRDLTSQLLASGAPIEEMNIVRKHLSQVQGGRLAQACAGQVLSLVISDVAGDDLSAIASGPFAPDSSTFVDAQEILSRWGVIPSVSITQHLRDGALGLVADTPKQSDAIFSKVKNVLIATAHQSLEAGARVFRAAGYEAIILGDTITGEARDVAQVMAGLTREILRFNAPFTAPVVLLSGGECTVTLRKKMGSESFSEFNARGGRCSEFLLALMVALGPQERVTAIACDTDGIDGSENNAGAVWVEDSFMRAKLANVSARARLDANDSYGFFESIGGLVNTGPTLTNVNDFRAIVIGP
jgi:glycerate 2-kinase